MMQQTDPLKLYSYWRSSAAFRVRIGLALKSLPYEVVPIHLVEDGGQQHSPDYARRNPQRMVPVLQHGHRHFRQSMAILEYIEEMWPDAYPLLPESPRDRQYVRMIAQTVACDIHPLANLRVVKFLESAYNADEGVRRDWQQHWVIEGLQVLETTLVQNPIVGRFCFGDQPGLADCFLVPQLYNARRLGIDLAEYPRLHLIYDECMALPAFQSASPERQPDAPAVA